MTTKYEFTAGQKVHNWILRGRVRTSKSASPNLRVKWRCECVCGKLETIPQYYLTRESPKLHCGCLRKTSRTIYNEEYRIWLMMHVRTEDPRHVAYKHYGGRGIKVCPEWHRSRDIEGFEAFLKFVGPRPSAGHSIDRVDNNLGYQPFQADGTTRQVRWATSSEQRANQRTPEEIANARKAMEDAKSPSGDESPGGSPDNGDQVHEGRPTST